MTRFNPRDLILRSETSSGFWRSRLARSIDSGNALPWLILAATACRFLMAATSPLTPQEAYYWTWSRFPDWSYFDHPPLVSHGIGLTTFLLGQTVLGIKSAAVLWSLGWNLLWMRLVSSMYRSPPVTFWTLLALNLTLLYELYGFGPTPDGPLLFGWIGTVWAVWRLTQTGRSKWWYVAGVFAGIASLGKYAGVLLFPVVGLYALAVPSLRRWLRRPQPYMAMAIAALIFSPLVIWNAQHDWASLAFQSTRRVGEMSAWKPRFFVVLVVTQFLLITPYLFVLSLAALWRTLRAWLRRNIEPHELLLLLSALVPLMVFVASSFRTNAKINWLMPAWWALIVLAMAGTATLHKHVRWRGWGLATSVLLLVAGMALVTIPNLPLPGDLNIWSGWKAAGVRVDQLVAAERAQGRRAFVFSPTYKTSSLLWFHRPSQERTYAQDVMGRKALQYGYFPRKETLHGATGFLVLSDQAQSTVNLDAIRTLFETVEQVDVEEVGAFGRTTRRIEIWKGTGYRGAAAPAASLVEEASP